MFLFTSGNDINIHQKTHEPRYPVPWPLSYLRHKLINLLPQQDVNNSTKSDEKKKPYCKAPYLWAEAFSINVHKSKTLTNSVHTVPKTAKALLLNPQDGQIHSQQHQLL